MRGALVVKCASCASHESLAVLRSDFWPWIVWLLHCCFYHEIVYTIERHRSDCLYNLCSLTYFLNDYMYVQPHSLQITYLRCNLLKHNNTNMSSPIGLTIIRRTLNGRVRSLSSDWVSNLVFAPQEGGGGEGVNHVDVFYQNRGFLAVWAGRVP